MKLRIGALSFLAMACAAGKQSAPAAAATPARVAAAPAAVAAADRPAMAELPGLGDYSRRISRASPEAQRWFDQGLKLVYGFNHDEALRAFARAAALSPGCAMCFWGIAYANGPHINNPEVSPDHASAAVRAVRSAQALGAAGVEQALIAALGKRYADPQPQDRSALDRAYADAMRAVRAAFPSDPDVAALTAEALMDLHPWDLYEPSGAPKPWTAPILEATEAALALSPRHPMANHLYIHAIEGSSNPGRGTRAAEVLRDLQPGLGHMVHMPSHIDVRTGQWAKAVAANERALEADRRLQALRPQDGFYALYIVHNHQMLSYAALMEGRSQQALGAARDMVAGIPEGFRKQATPFVDGYYAMPLEVLMRFGRWDEILAAPEFPEDLPASRALRHAARGIALAAKGEPAAARAERAVFEAARAKVPREFMMGQNPVSSVLAIASHLLAGEVLYKSGAEAAAFVELRKAVEAEDALLYDEPPAWIQPVRHALGAALSQSRRYAEAEAVFREDLRRLPENGWSLFGLSRALRLQGKQAEAAEAEARFARAWSEADVKLESACFCQQGV